MISTFARSLFICANIPIASGLYYFKPGVSLRFCFETGAYSLTSSVLSGLGRCRCGFVGVGMVKS